MKKCFRILTVIICLLAYSIQASFAEASEGDGIEWVLVSSSTFDTDYTEWIPVNAKGTTIPELKEISGRNAILITNTEESDWARIVNNFSTSYTSGKIRIKYALYMPNISYTCTVATTASSADKNICAIDAGWVRVGPDNEQVLKATANTWYMIEHVFDIDTKEANTTITPEDSASVSRNQTWDMTGLTCVFFTTGWSKGAALAVDDYSFEIGYDAPALTYESIGIEAGSAENTVSASVKEIDINFGAVMNSGTLTSENITLINLTDNEDIVFTGRFEGKKYILSIPDMLLPNRDYELKVSGNVENVLGVKLGSDFIYNFKTDAGEKTMSLSLLKNGQEITSFAEITNGAYNIAMDYLNTTETDSNPVLVISFYKDNKLVKTTYRTSNMYIEPDVKNKQFKYSLFVSGITEVDSLRIFMLDSINTMSPVCAGLIF